MGANSLYFRCLPPKMHCRAFSAVGKRPITLRAGAFTHWEAAHLMGSFIGSPESAKIQSCLGGGSRPTSPPARLSGSMGAAVM